MTKLRKKIVYFIFTFSVNVFVPNCCLLFSQNPTFRQQYTQRILSNPAMIGLGQYEGLSHARIALTTRAQWLSQEGRLLTQSAFYDNKIKSSRANWAAGVTATDLYSGVAGNARYSHFIGSAAYAYTIPGKILSARFGLVTQLSNYSFGTGRYTWEDQVDQNFTGFVNPTQEPNSTLTRRAFHVGAGGLFYNHNFFAGLSVYNINQPDVSLIPGNEIKLLKKYQLIAGYNLENVWNNTSVMPHLLILKQQNLQCVAANILIKVNNIQLGTGFQKSQSNQLKNYSLTNYLGLQFGKANIGYSLDWNLTYSTGTLPLTHEFSVLWMISTANSKHKQELICLPEF
jgi:type IX secretion system PorP/SprF family membrane protein